MGDKIKEREVSGGVRPRERIREGEMGVEGERERENGVGWRQREREKGNIERQR